jgi:alkylhydroperoxidase/carboxymuconolactone decarboxylase family protein YurZ
VQIQETFPATGGVHGVHVARQARRTPHAGPRRFPSIPAPPAKLVELTDNVLFGGVWARPELSQRDRSLVTVSALIAMNRPEQLRSHRARARDNGYAGWPSAITAISVAREVFEKR